MAGFQSQSTSSAYYDAEAQRQRTKILFSEEKIRREFIGKVYMILMTQIMGTLAFMSFTTFHEPTQIWLIQHVWLMWVAMILMFVVMIPLACCQSVARSAPCNYILLFIFTCCVALLFGTLTLIYPSNIILMAVGITAIVFLALTIFAFIVPLDFTMCYGVLLIAIILFIIFTIVAMFFQSRTLEVVKASIGVGIFSVYVIADTQMMMGGNHKFAYSPEDYVIAALNLYIDFVNMFLFILTLLDD